MRKHITCGILVVIITAIFALQIFAASDIGVVNLTAVQQPNDYWCWAACAESILNYFEKSVTLETFASFVTESNPPLEIGATDSKVQEGLANWDVIGTLVSNSISFSTVSSNIRSGRPIYAGWTWTIGGGHAVVINGFDGADAGTGYVEYMDPLDAEIHMTIYGMVLYMLLEQRTNIRRYL